MANVWKEEGEGGVRRGAKLAQSLFAMPSLKLAPNAFNGATLFVDAPAASVYKKTICVTMNQNCTIEAYGARGGI